MLGLKSAILIVIPKKDFCTLRSYCKRFYHKQPSSKTVTWEVVPKCLLKVVSKLLHLILSPHPQTMLLINLKRLHVLP